MSNKEKFIEFVQSISFRELTLTMDLLISSWILYFYATKLVFASSEQLASVEWVSGILLKVIIYSVVLAIANALLLKFICSENEDEQPLDEREQKIDLLGYKYSYWVLQAGVCIAIFQYGAEAQGFTSSVGTLPFLPLHILVVAFIMAEITHYGMQLIKGRMGAMYG